MSILTNIFRKKQQAVRQFKKTIYSYDDKTDAQIMDILRLELETLVKNNAGFTFHNISMPDQRKQGRITYTITLKQTNVTNTILL